MRKQMWRFVLITVLITSACAPQTGIEARDAWARPAQQGGNGAVYLSILSHLEEAEELVGVTSEVTDTIEIHESMMSGDVMQMHPLHSVPLEPGAQVQFEPGGLHIMLVALKEDLKLGNTFEITLQFQNYPDLTVNVAVQDSP